MKEKIIFAILCMFIFTKMVFAGNNADVDSLIHQANKSYFSSTENSLKLSFSLLNTNKKLTEDQKANIYEIIGRNYIRKHDFNLAFQYLNKSYKHWNKKPVSINLIKIYENFAFLNIKKYNFEEGLYYINKTRSALKHLGLESKYTTINLLEALYLKKTCKFDLALDLLNKALQNPDIKLKIEFKHFTYTQIGDILLKQDKIDLAKSFYFKALNLASSNNRMHLRNISLINLSYVYIAEHQESKALNCCDKVLDELSKNDNKNIRAKTYLCLSYIYSSFQQIDLACDYLDNAYKIYSKQGSQHKVLPCIYKLAKTQIKIKEYEKAQIKIRSAIRISKNCSDRYYEAVGYKLLAQTQLEQGLKETSTKTINKAINIFKLIDNNEGIANSYNILVLNKLSSNKKEEAYLLLKETEKLSNKLNINSIQATTNINLGKYFYNQNNLSLALKYFLKSLSRLKNLHKHKEISETAKYISKIYEQNKDYKKSLSYHKKYALHYSKQYNAETESKIGWIIKENEIKKNEEFIDFVLADKQNKKQNKTKQKQINSYIIFISILVIIFIGLSISFYKSIKRVNFMLSQENEERRNAEYLLEEHQLNLENLIKFRTKELIMAKEKAEMSDKLKTAFLANVSHEIRTPMNSIIGFSKLLSMTDSKEKHNHYAKIINENGKVLLTLVDDIIDSSIIESNQLKIKISEFSINSLLEELYFIFKEDMKNSNRSNVELIYHKPQQKHIIQTDRVRLKQMMVNLLRNAVKFTKQGKIEFGANMTNKEYIFFVKDSGIGIPEKDRKYIFDRFRQASNNKVEFGGTGLGLSISKNLSNLLQGDIWIDPKVSKGCRFFIKLPVRYSKDLNCSNTMLVESSEHFNNQT
ncbi:MAG: ATP-binding protein [Marinifilaceae bacterium]|jgi:signal transduction histidine kinase/predicted negative regulator of RcsB-dependent stress response|nr:ATP-binding protein [Marinifilaceae bacterium]